jgi:hypothetical protein
MKFISSHDDNLSEPVEEKIYNIRGELAEDDEKIYSRILNKKYFVRTLNNVPFDPFGPEAGRQIWNRTELKSVSKITFENYNNYLTTRNRLFWTKTNRSYIDG